MGNSASSSKTMSNESPAAFIDSTIASHQVVIFAKTWCGYCRQTKQLFAGLEEAKDVEIVDLDKRSDGDAIQRTLAEKTGQRTVPSIFVGQKFMGGNDEIQKAHSTGKLVPILLACSQ